MSAQQETSRGNITLTFCVVSIPANGPLELSERGMLVGKFRGRLAPTGNTLQLDVSQCPEKGSVGDSRPSRRTSSVCTPENVKKTRNVSLRNPR
jgi:hypothetical protein